MRERLARELIAGTFGFSTARCARASLAYQRLPSAVRCPGMCGMTRTVYCMGHATLCPPSDGESGGALTGRHGPWPCCRSGGEGAARLGADFELIGPEAPLPPELDGRDSTRLRHPHQRLRAHFHQCSGLTSVEHPVGLAGEVGPQQLGKLTARSLVELIEQRGGKRAERSVRSRVIATRHGLRHPSLLQPWGVSLAGGADVLPPCFRLAAGRRAARSST